MNTALRALLASLDEEQAAVAAWRPADGNLRVSATAGSGKTRSITALSAVLLTERVVQPNRLILCTFAKKAATTLSTRLLPLLDNPTQLPRVGTFHGLALERLRQLGQPWDMSRCLDVAARSRGAHLPSTSLLWRTVVEWGTIPGLNKPSLKIAKSADDVKLYSSFADVCRSYGYDSIEDMARDGEIGDRLLKKAPERFDEAWDTYNAAKGLLGMWDFADTLSAYLRVVKQAQDSADVVIVDEAQDNSRIQLSIATRLAEPAGKVVLTGDPAQAVHRWRGAFPSLFINADTIVGAKTLTLSTNYRSVPDVVSLGNRILYNRGWKTGPVARPQRGSTSLAIDAVEDAEDHAVLVAEIIAAALRKGQKPGDFAILSRTNAQLGDYSAALAGMEIPYTIYGGDSLFETKEALTVLSYCVLSERDAYGSLERVLHAPKRFLGKPFVEAVKQRGPPMLDAIQAVSKDLSPGQQKGAYGLLQSLRELRATPWPAVIDKIEALVMPRSEKVRRLQEGESPDEDRAGWYQAALRQARRSPSADAFLDRAQAILGMAQSAAEDADATPDRVMLSTVHRFKGREAPHVFLHAEAGSFPSARACDAEEIEDELRLFYVGVTRARDRLTFVVKKSACEFLIRFGEEIVREHLGETALKAAEKPRAAGGGASGKIVTRRRAKA